MPLVQHHISLIGVYYFKVPEIVVNLVRAYFHYIRLFHNRLAEIRKRYNGRVYNFPIGIYNGNGNDDQSFSVGGRW